MLDDCSSRRKALSVMGTLFFSGCGGLGYADTIRDSVDLDDLRNYDLSQISNKEYTWPMARYDSKNSGRYLTNISVNENDYSVLDKNVQDATPIIIDDWAFYQRKNKEVIIHREKDKTVTLTLNQDVLTSVAIIGDLLIISATSNIFAIDLSDSSVSWTKSLGTIRCDPIVTTNYVFAAGGSDYHGFQKDSGKESFHYTQPNHRIQGAAIIDSYVVMVATSNNKGELHCADIDTGSKKWSQSINPSYAPPVIDDDGVYVQDESGIINKYKLGDGENVWTTTASSLSRPPSITSELIIVNGGHEGIAYGINKESGIIEWSFETGFAPMSPLVVQNSLILGSGNNGVYQLNKEDGRLLTHYPNIRVRKGPVVGGSGLYAISVNNEIIKIR